MKLSPSVEALLIDAKGIGGLCPDEHDIKVAEIMENWREMDSVDLGILGVPFDTSVMYRPGCRFGPESIRNGLVFSNIYEPGLDCNLAGLKVCVNI